MNPVPAATRWRSVRGLVLAAALGLPAPMASGPVASGLSLTGLAGVVLIEMGWATPTMAQTAAPASRPPAPGPAGSAPAAPAQTVPTQAAPAPGATSDPSVLPIPAGMTLQEYQGLSCISFGLMTALGVFIYSDIIVEMLGGTILNPMVLVPVMATGFAAGCSVGSTMSPGLLWIMSRF